MIRFPINRPGAPKPHIRPGLKKAANAVFNGVKNYGKNVYGGAKIVEEAVLKAFRN